MRSSSPASARALSPLLLLAFAAAALSAPLDPGAACAPPARMQGRHCVCPAQYTCAGSACSRGSDFAGRTVSGFDVQLCGDCACVLANGDQPQATKPAEEGRAGPRAASAAKGQQAQDFDDDPPAERRRSEAVVKGELAQSPRRPFAYLKFHKVGSTTVSIALERLAERQSLKLCGRDQDFIPSMPCKAWTTHDTEFVLIGGGVPGIRFFVGHTAALITLLRDPMERLLSRYYYDRVLNGVTGSAPLTLHELDEWLKGPGAVETVHYVRVLSRGTLDYDEAERNLEEFDVVGLAEALDDFFTVVSAVLDVPPEALTYKNEKVVVGRPKVADMDTSVRARLAEVTALDRKLYSRAAALSRLQQDKVRDFATRRSQFQSAQEAVDQRCTYKDTQSNVLTGKDCYNL